MHRRRAALLVALTLLAPAALVVPRAIAGAEERAKLRAAKERLAAREFAAAATDLERVAREVTEVSLQDEARVLQARALWLARDLTKAVDAARAFVAARPDSPFVPQARYVEARALLQAGKADEAAALLEARLGALLAPARRGELAQSYLAVADEAFAPSATTPPGASTGAAPPQDLERARQAYEQALTLGDEPLAGRADEVRFRVAECLASRGRHGEAAQAFARVRAPRPGTPVAPALVAASLLREAVSRAEVGELEGARALLRRLREEQPKAAEAALALEVLGDTFAREQGGEEARRQALAAYERFLAESAGHARAGDVLLKVVAVQQAAGRWQPALDALRSFVERFPQAPQAGEVRFQAGEALLALGRFDEARAAYGAFLGAHPSHPRFVEAQDRIATSWIDQGALLAEAPASLDAALAAWRGFLSAYPVHARAPEVERRAGDLCLLRGRAAEAETAWRAVSQRYPNHPEGAKAQAALARLAEEGKKELALAVKELEDLIARFPGQPEAWQARQTLQALKQKELALRSPRARTIAEGAAFTLACRNIAKLELKAWRVDPLETFEKKGTLSRTDELAIDIVKPDATWTHEVAAYEPFRRFEAEVKLPALAQKGPGAWIVTAEEDDLRAVLLVLVSDLTTVVKRAPGQLLVLVKDEATGAAAPGVDVVVRGGGELVRGKTGPDGVWLADVAGATGQTAILAHRAGSVALDDGRPGGGEGSFGHTPKSYVFTDRPVYRPGQVVRWKAICRDVEAGQYACPRGATVQVEVQDARGVRLVSAERSLSELGSLDGQVELGPEAPLGDYTVQVTRAGTTGVATFSVEAYKKPEVQVEVTPAREDVLAGEPLAVAVNVKTYYGGVVADAPVEWTVTRSPSPFDREAHKGFAWFYEAARGEQEEGAPAEQVASGRGTTDATGKLELSLVTAAIDADMLYTVSVTSRGLDGRPVRGAANVPVTTAGYFAFVEAGARVARPGQPLGVLVETVDARHRGIPAEGVLRVARRTGQAGEEVVLEVPAKTDAAGRAQVEVRLPRAGEYTLRFVGKDRRGGPVEGATQVLAEGVDEARRVTLRAEREVYRRGDSARVVLGLPAEQQLALFTVEAEKIIEYRVLRPSSRADALELKLGDAHAPNVTLALAAPTRDGLLVAEDPLLVFRYLDVAVRPTKAEHAPGEEVVVEVETRGPTGEPVQAEVAVAVVDEAIFAVKADRTPGTKPFFYDQRRTHSVTTSSSVTWSHAGVTRAQRRELQAEREERELAGALAQEENGRRESLRRASGNAPPPPPAPKPSAAPGGPRGGGGRAMADAEESEPMMEKAMAADSDDGTLSLEGSSGEGGEAPAAPVRRRFADTALWAPTVTTGPDGKARVTLRAPDDLTTWRVTARGATKETLVGDAEARFRTTKSFVVSLALPRTVTTLDSYLAGVVVDDRSKTADDTCGSVSLQADGLDVGTGPFVLAKRSQERVDLKGPVGRPGTRLVQASGVTEDGRKDAIERPLPVFAVGAPEQQGASGLLEARAVATFDLPADVVPGTAELVIVAAPSAAAQVLDGLEWLDAFPYGCTEQTVSRFLPLVAAQRLLRASGLPDEALRQRLLRGAERGVRQLLDLQRSDGAWGWFRDGSPDAANTAYALHGLQLAAGQTFVDPDALERGREAARRLLRQVGADDDARALLVAALALRGPEAAGELDDALNRCLRARGGLSTKALAHLVLAHAWLQRGAGLAELTAALRERLKSEGGLATATTGVAPGAGGTPRSWCGSDGEALAWAGYALAQATPDDPLVAAAANGLRARQAADGSWRSTRETAAALLLLAAHEGQKTTGVDYTLEVQLGGARVMGVRVQGALGPAERRVVLSGDRLKPGKNELVLTKEGSGAPRWTARLRYLRAVDQRQDPKSPTVAAAGTTLRVGRDLVAWDDPRRPRAYPGQASILKPSAAPPATVEKAARGEPLGLRVRVEALAGQEGSLPYALVEVPLPGGVEVVDPSEAPLAVSGARCDRLEVKDDRLALFFSALPAGATEVRVRVQAVTPGTFVLRAATAELVYEPEVAGRSASASLEVTTQDDAKRAPGADERLIAARALAQRGAWAELRTATDGLLALDLIDEARAELLRLRLAVAVGLEDAGLAVSAYEALKDHAPRALGQLDLPERRFVAWAYRQQRQGERSCALVLDLCHALLADEARLAAFYRGVNRPHDAQRRLSRALLEYPDTDPIVAAWFDWARTFLDLPRPAEAAPGAPRPKFWRPDGAAARDAMLEEAYVGLKDFVAWFPTHALAPQAQQLATDALSRLGDDEGVAREADLFARRYPQDLRVDDVLVLRLRALARLNRFEDALACGQLVLAWRERRSNDTTTPSPFCDEVLHTFARLYHQRGELKQAVKYYAQVAARIPDARDALEYFTAPRLELPEVVTVEAGQEARLPVKSKNIEKLAFKVYPVDFMILFLTRLDLANIHDIDLTGITPLVQREAALGATDDLAWRDTQVALPAKDPGVYLVVGKAGALDRSALVVVSDLRIDVQRVQNRVRVYARTKDGKPAPGARVRVTDGSNLVARGTTDARGVFDGEVRSGRPLSVVAEREGHYALFREQR